MSSSKGKVFFHFRYDADFVAVLQIFSHTGQIDAWRDAMFAQLPPGADSGKRVATS